MLNLELMTRQGWLQNSVYHSETRAGLTEATVAARNTLAVATQVPI